MYRIHSAQGVCIYLDKVSGVLGTKKTKTQKVRKEDATVTPTLGHPWNPKVRLGTYLGK